MPRIKIVFTVLLMAIGARAQEPGYFGKKTFVELNASVRLPVLLNIFTEKGYNASLKESYNLKDFSFSASLGMMTSDDVGVAFEYQHRFYQINALRGQELNRQYVDEAGVEHTDYITPRVSLLDVQEQVFMPRSILTLNSTGISAGFSQELGVGYSLITVSGKNVQADYTPQNGLTADSIKANLLDTRIGQLNGIVFLYGVKLSFPLTKSMLFNIGFRYTYCAMLGKKDYRDYEQTTAWLSAREAWSRVNQRRQFSVLNTGIGFTFYL